MANENFLDSFKDHRDDGGTEGNNIGQIEANKYKSQKFPFLNNLVSHNISLRALLGLLKLL